MVEVVGVCVLDSFAVVSSDNAYFLALGAVSSAPHGVTSRAPSVDTAVDAAAAENHDSSFLYEPAGIGGLDVYDS